MKTTIERTGKALLKELTLVQYQIDTARGAPPGRDTMKRSLETILRELKEARERKKRENALSHSKDR